MSKLILKILEACSNYLDTSVDLVHIWHDGIHRNKGIFCSVSSPLTLRSRSWTEIFAFHFHFF